MLDVITIGETMAVFTPTSRGNLRYVNNFNLKIAGAESNLAIGMQKLGFSAGWISKVGNDEFGRLIINILRGEGVDVSNTSFDDAHATGLMIKEYSGFGDTNVYYYRKESAASTITADDINEEYIKMSKLIHLTGITPLLSGTCYEAVQKTIDIAHDHNILISFDPNIRLKLWKDQKSFDTIKRILVQSNIVLLGLDESEILFGTRNVNDLLSLMQNNKNINYLVVKNGKDGAWVSNKDELYKIDPYQCNSIDSIGAGDAFNAGFLAGILEGSDLKTCGQMGAVCGALATQSYGDFEGFPSKEEVSYTLHNKKRIHR